MIWSDWRPQMEDYAPVYSYVDITSYAVLTNLPRDVVKVLTWAGVLDVASAVMEIVALLIISGKTISKTGPISSAINWLAEHFGKITTTTERIVTSLSATSTFVRIAAHVASQDYGRGGD